jgi:hypothetical protein
MTTLRVFTFTPDWGLPSAGPFAIKLLAWLELAGIPHEQVIAQRQGTAILTNVNNDALRKDEGRQASSLPPRGI